MGVINMLDTAGDLQTIGSMFRKVVMWGSAVEVAIDVSPGLML